MITAREVTSPEAVNMRTDNQWVQLGLCIVNPPVVFSALLNGVPNYLGGLYDNISVLTYDNASGIAYSAIKPDSTILVGSTPGAGDLGQVRFRSATATTITIGRTSDVIWYDNCYLTILDEVGIWNRQQWMDINTGAFTCDDDVPYTDQHTNPTPVPVLGPDRIVERVGSSVVVQLDASDSWVFGGTITGYLWSASSGVTLSSTTIANPTATMTAGGQYVVHCQVTASNGKTWTGHRHLVVYDAAHPLLTQFTLKNLGGEWTDGGWSFDVEMYAQASLPTVRPRAKVFLVAKQYYGNLQVDQGPVAGMERQLCDGWIATESIDWNAELSVVKFSVKGPAWWLQQVTSWQAALVDSTYAPTGWMQFLNLNFDKFCWHVLNWRSTATEVIDFYPSGDTRRTVGVSMKFGSIWSQMETAGQSKFFLYPRCNRFGQLFIQLDPQFVPEADRSAFPVIMTIQKIDWKETLTIESRTVPVDSIVDATGMSWDGTTPAGFRSGSYGRSIARHGKYDHRTELVVTGQAQNDQIAGLIMGLENNPLPRVTVPFAGQNFFFDITPHQYATINVAAGDTPRGIVLTNQDLVPRGISYEWDEESGMLLPTITFEGKSEPALATPLPFPSSGTPPPPYNPPPGPVPINPPPPPITPPPPPPEPPPVPGGSPCATDMAAGPTGPFVVSNGFTIYGNPSPPMDFVYTCMIRSSGAANQSRVMLEGYFEKTLDSGATWVPDLTMSNYRMEALTPEGALVGTVVWDAVTDAGYGKRYGTINHAGSPFNVYFWRLTIGGTSTGTGHYYKYGDVIYSYYPTGTPTQGPNSGAWNQGAPKINDTGFSLIEGQLYCAEGVDSGPWYNGSNPQALYRHMVWPGGAINTNPSAWNFGYGQVEAYGPIDPLNYNGYWDIFFKFINPTYFTVGDMGYDGWLPTDKFADNTGEYVRINIYFAGEYGTCRFRMDSFVLYNICPWTDLPG